MEYDCDLAIVGGGLFGCIIGRAFRHAGFNVIILDAKLPNAGSKPAACLMKPGWFSGFSKGEVKESLELLDKLYGVSMLPFEIAPKVHSTVFWVDPEKVLSEPKEYEDVISVHGHVVTTKERVFRARRIVIAAGIWTKHLDSRLDHMQGKAGVAYTSPGQIDPFIKVWAPYKQLVGFNIKPNKIWVGDGSSINYQNWSPERELASFKRCEEYLQGEPQKLFGVRPYFPGEKPCYLKQRDEVSWTATGGAKNGTLAAAWCANRLLETIWLT